MSSRVTLRDIAAKSGVHFATVARALKNDPRVRAGTREHVARVAAELGYRPDPMLSALSAYRHSKQFAGYHGTVAWVTNFPKRDGWERETFCLYREGAREVLAKVGYRLEDFWLMENGMSQQRAGEILYNRGIRGLLICPLPLSRSSVQLQWERFASVTFGYTLSNPPLHMLTPFHYNGMQLALKKMKALGYRRIGLVIPERLNRRTHQFWVAAYHTLMLSEKVKDAPPILYLRESDQSVSKANRRQFIQWFRNHRPDAVLAFWTIHCQWLEEEGLRIPEDVGFASLCLQESGVWHSGVVEPSREVGRAAGNFLSAMLHRGEYGLPSAPQRILLDGTWQTGNTLRKTVKSDSQSS